MLVFVVGIIFTHSRCPFLDLSCNERRNLYQIFSYVKNLEAFNDGNKQIAGMLLYAKTLDQVQPDDVYYMSGNTIAVRALDLNQDFNDIRKDLDEIYDEFISRKIFASQIETNLSIL